MFFFTIKLDRVSFETKGRENLQKTADFVIESIVFWLVVMLRARIFRSLIPSVNVISPGFKNEFYPLQRGF